MIVSAEVNKKQANKLLATEMDFWRSARKLRKEKVRNGTIREIMEVGKNILEGTRGNAKKRKTQREMDR
jgi:hypothetical protein